MIDSQLIWQITHLYFFFSSRRRHTRFKCDWSSDVCSSDLSITAKTPLGPATQQASLRRDVVVTNPDGTSATLTAGFSYFVPPLSIATVSPTVGATGGGTVVTITGTGFTTGVQSSVTFGGVAATNVTIVDAITLQATTPPHAVGTVDIVVTLGTSVSKPNAFTYQTIPPRHRAVRH